MSKNRSTRMPAEVIVAISDLVAVAVICAIMVAFPTLVAVYVVGAFYKLVLLGSLLGTTIAFVSHYPTRRAGRIIWFWIVHPDEDLPAWAYDSSIQRSNFKFLNLFNSKHSTSSNDDKTTDDRPLKAAGNKSLLDD